MGLCNRCSVTVPNAQPRNAVPERSERLDLLAVEIKFWKCQLLDWELEAHTNASPH